MTFGKILIFAVVLIVLASDAFQSGANADKHTTTSRAFMRLRSDQTKQCLYINNDFDKLEGLWYFILRTVVPRTTPMIQCGRLYVGKTSSNEFEATIKYQSSSGQFVYVPINGQSVNESMVELPAMKQLITGNPEWIHPFTVQMGICDDDSILFIEPIHYMGGSMVFTRAIPDNISALKIRFGTHDEHSGKERTVKIPTNCVTL